MAKEKVVGLTVRLPETLKNQIAKKAMEERRSLNTQIIKVLEDSTRGNAKEAA